MQRIILLILPLCVIFSHVSSENCYYREAKESKDNYLDCQYLASDEPIEGISLIHLKHNTTIPVLKKGLISPFKNLKTLYITAANVERIEPGALNNFKLEMVDLYHNRLKTIENGTFNSLATLKYLDLSYNKIESLEAHTFTGLISLEWLSLNSNHLKTISKVTFNHLKNLKALYLHFNEISQLEAGTFQNLVNLELLDLSFNSLTKIQFGLFADQRNLQTLLLKHNYLEGLADRLFDNVTSLTVLDISQNKFKQLQENLFYHTNELEILKFTSNNITEFNSTILLNYTPKLREVHLFYNQWKCDTLKNIVEDFEIGYVYIATGTPVLASNVHGVGCNE